MTASTSEPSAAPDVAGRRLADNATKVYDVVAAGGWVGSSLRTDVGLGPLGDVHRPVDQLAGAGLGWLSGQVQPMQDVLDEMTGNAAVIRSFADTWRDVSGRVTEIQSRLAAAASADTAGWAGAAADRYRTAATGLAAAVTAIGTLSKTVAAVAEETGKAAAAARQRVADLVTELVQRLVREVPMAIAAEGGITAAVLSAANTLVNEYSTPVTEILTQLRSTLGNATTQVGGVDIALNATRAWLAAFASRDTTTREAGGGDPIVLAQNTRALSSRLSQEKLREVTDDYLFDTPLSRFIQYREQGRYAGQLDWSSDGCTSAFDQPAGWNFLPACQRHDFGYRNYQHQDRFTAANRRRVDEQFYADLTAICRRFTGDADYTDCQAARDVYYRAVRQLGGP